jgi:3-oxoacyl-[acyl-carrier protein] reductase
VAGRLDGCVAIVTGGGHGIGKEYCRGLAAEGARVAIAEIDADAAIRAAQELKDGGAEALAVPTDVSDVGSTQAMASKTVERFGRIDILVNNAALFVTVPMSRVPLVDLTVEEWDHLMAVNLRGMFLTCKAVVPVMIEQERGKIINISSGRALANTPNSIHYVTSKAGVLGFTRTLAGEVGRYGITVNSIAPGSTLSEENPSEEVVRMRGQRVGARAIPRIQVPADLVGSVIFFASSESDFVTGQTLVVDGGTTMH